MFNNQRKDIHTKTKIFELYGLTTNINIVIQFPHGKITFYAFTYIINSVIIIGQILKNHWNRFDYWNTFIVSGLMQYRDSQGTERERTNREWGCWPELQGAVRFWGLSLVRGCLAMRGLPGWLRFKDTTVDKPPTRLEKGVGEGDVARGRKWKELDCLQTAKIYCERNWSLMIIIPFKC